MKLLSSPSLLSSCFVNEDAGTERRNTWPGTLNHKEEGSVFETLLCHEICEMLQNKAQLLHSVSGLEKRDAMNTQKDLLC